SFNRNRTAAPDARDQDLYRRLPLRRGALRGDRRPQQRRHLQLLDLPEARRTLDLRDAGAFRVARRIGGSEGLPVRQEGDPPPVLPAMRGGRLLARNDAEGRRNCGGQRPLPRRPRYHDARAHAVRRPQPVAGSRAPYRGYTPEHSPPAVNSSLQNGPPWDPLPTGSGGSLASAGSAPPRCPSRRP